MVSYRLFNGKKFYIPSDDDQKIMSKRISRRKVADGEVRLTTDEIALLLRAVRLTNLTMEMVEIADSTPARPQESFESRQNTKQTKPALIQLAAV